MKRGSKKRGTPRPRTSGHPTGRRERPAPYLYTPEQGRVRDHSDGGHSGAWRRRAYQYAGNGRLSELGMENYGFYTGKEGTETLPENNDRKGLMTDGFYRSLP